MYTSDEEPVRKHHHFMPLRQVQPKVLAPLPRQSDNLETAPPTEAQIKEQQRHEKLIKSRVSSQKWREKKKRLAAEPRTAARAAVTTVARTHLHHSMAYSDEDIEELPQDCHHYRHVGEVPWDIQKYWQQRHSIFTKYDEGIWMTDDAWFGVTPEPVANKIAKHISSAARAGETVLIDTFAGAGGNVIAFARHGRWQRICAIEKDPQLLRCARHNARIYGVEDKIEWFEGDCFEVLLDHFHSPLTQHSVVFASPPWGGPGYRSDRIFNLQTMQPYSIYDIIRSFSKISRDLAIYLPRTSDLRQLAGLVVEDEKLDIVHYCMEGASKALCVYYGGLSQLRNQ